MAYMVLVDVAKSLFYRAQPSTAAAQPAADPRSVRRLHRRAAPFMVKALTGPGRFLLHRSKPTAPGWP